MDKMMDRSLKSYSKGYVSDFGGYVSDFGGYVSDLGGFVSNWWAKR
jgi:hypothetical protein